MWPEEEFRKAEARMHHALTQENLTAEAVRNMTMEQYAAVREQLLNREWDKIKVPLSELRDVSRPYLWEMEVYDELPGVLPGFRQTRDGPPVNRVDGATWVAPNGQEYVYRSANNRWVTLQAALIPCMWCGGMFAGPLIEAHEEECGS